MTSTFRITFTLLFTAFILNMVGQSEGWHLYKEAPENLSPVQIESTDDGTLYVLTDQGHMYYREESDEEWSLIQNVQGYWNHDNFNVHPVTKRLFVGTLLEGIVYSDDHGSDWGGEYFATNPVSGFHPAVNSIGIDVADNMIFLAGGNLPQTPEIESQRSFNNGNTWQSVEVPTGFGQFHMRDNDQMLASGWGGLFRSDDNGSTWTGLGEFNGMQMTDFAEDSSGRIFATIPETLNESSIGVYVSIDNGDSWMLTIDGLDDIQALCVNYNELNGDVLLGTGDGLYRFEDNGWEPISMPFSDTPINDVHTVDGTVYMASSFYGIYRMEAGQSTWEPFNHGLHGGLSEYLFNGDDELIAAYAQGEGYALLDDAESDWERHQLPENTDNALGIVQMERLTTGEVYMLDFDELFYSSDDGTTFGNITPDLPLPAGAFYRYFSQMDVTEAGEILLLHFSDDTLFHSLDGGLTYQVVFSTDDVEDVIGPTIIIEDFVRSPTMGYNVLSRDATGEFRYHRSDNGVAWQEVDYTSIDPNSSGSGHELHMLNDGQVGFTFSHRLFLLDPLDNGLSEIPVPWTMSNPNSEFELAQDGNGAYYVSVFPTFSSIEYAGVWRTMDDGLNWTDLGFPEDAFGDPKYTTDIGFNMDDVPFVLSGNVDPGGALMTVPGIYYYGEEGGFLGVEDFIGPGSELTVYPNPIGPGQVITIKGEGLDSRAEITLFDIQGRLVPTSVDYTMGRATVATTGLPDGMYHLQLSLNGQSVRSMKVIIYEKTVD